MSGESTKIDIAGYPVLIKAASGKMPDGLKKRLHPHRTAQNPRYFITLLRKRTPPGCGSRRGLRISDVTAEKRGGTLVFSAGPDLPIGTLAPGGRTACFFVYENALSRDYFMPFLRTVFQLFIAQKGEVILHACGVSDNGTGLIFTGPSGCGKTTISKFYPRGSVLSDEFICLRRTQGGYYAYAVPWERGNPGCFRPDRIFFPVQAGKLKLVRTTRAAALQGLMVNAVYPVGAGRALEKIFRFLSEFAAATPCYEMYFPKNAGFKKEVLNASSGN